MSSNVAPAGPRRRHMAQRIQIGQSWRRRKDGSTWTVRNVWRVDRLALMELVAQNATEENVRRTVRFSELQAKWEQVDA